jgi:hypothetical protein
MNNAPFSHQIGIFLTPFSQQKKSMLNWHKKGIKFIPNSRPVKLTKTKLIDEKK